VNAPQNFIFSTIGSYGSLINTTVTTTRKARLALPAGCSAGPRLTRQCVARQFFNILMSVVVNKSYLRPGQWAGVFMVFSGIGWQMMQKRHAKKQQVAAKGGDTKKES